MRSHPILLLAVGLTLAACGDTSGPSVGTLVVSTSTGGMDPDQDGYLLRVDAVDSLLLPPSGTAAIDLPAGKHTLRLLGVAEHCGVAPATPVEMDVPPQGTISLAFEITCPLTGVRVSTTTTGPDPDPDGYLVQADGADLAIVPASGAVLTRLDPGSRTIALTGLSPNCTVSGPGLQTVTILAGELTSIDFGVACTATSGVIEVVISGNGVGVLHEAMVDGVTPFPVGPRDRAYLAGVPAGDHVVSLSTAAGCSVNTPEQPVTVTTGSLIRDTVEVGFSVSCTPAARSRIAFVREPQPGSGGIRGGPPSIYIANADGSGAATLTSGENPAWSPDGRRIAFNRGGMILVIDVNGSNERSLGEGGNPAWSPDGTRIVFHTGFNRDDGIFVMNADGSGRRRLIRRDFANPGSGDWTGWPEWSPDGRHISFVRAPDYDSYEPWQIYVMNTDGSDPHNLNVLRSIGGSFAEVHSWSPDGSRIALGVDRESWTIASVDSSGADYRVHYQGELNGYAAHPDWSPDGLSLVFEKYVIAAGCEKPSCPMRIFLVSAAGGPARQLIPELAQAPAYWDHQPAWSRAHE